MIRFSSNPIDNIQEDPEWDLSEEMVGDLKEIFIMFDKDTDGVLTIEQVSQSILDITNKALK